MSFVIEDMLHALIADDDESVRARLERLCINAGLAVELVSSLKEGMAHLEQASYDVLITDWVLPDGSGIDLAMRGLDHRPGCGIVLLGETGSIGLANSLLHGEVGAFIKKPLPEDGVLAIELERVLGEVRERPVVKIKGPAESEREDRMEPSHVVVTDDAKKMAEDRVKSMPPTGGEKIEAALGREQTLEVDESELDDFADAFENAFEAGGGSDDAKTRPVEALSPKTDQEGSGSGSGADRAFQIRFRSVPEFTSSEEEARENATPRTEEEAFDTNQEKTSVSARAPLADDDDDVMEISDDDFQSIEDEGGTFDDVPAASASSAAFAAAGSTSSGTKKPMGPASAPSPPSPTSETAPKTKTFEKDAVKTAARASTRKVESPAGPPEPVTQIFAAQPGAESGPNDVEVERVAPTKKRKKRKQPPQSVGSTTVVTSIVARPVAAPSDGDGPSVIIREPSAQNVAAPGPKEVDASAATFEAVTVAVPALAEATEAKEDKPKKSVAATSSPLATDADRNKAFEPVSVAGSRTIAERSISDVDIEVGEAAPGVPTARPVAKPAAAIVTADSIVDDGIDVDIDAPPTPPTFAGVDRPAPGASATSTAASKATKATATKATATKATATKAADQSGGLPEPASNPFAFHLESPPAVTPSKPAGERKPPAVDAVAPNKSAADVDAGFSDDDLSALKDAVGSADNAAFAFAAEVAGAFDGDAGSGAGDDETSFVIDFDEVDDRNPPAADDNVERTWVVDTRSIGVVSRELNQEVWTLNQPAESTGIHVLEDIEHYSIERKLADGKHASVYLARWPGDAKPIALKVLSPALSDDIAFRQRFRREIRSQAALSHENIVSVVRYGRRNQSYFLAMELMEGTLQDIMSALGRLPTAIVTSLLEDVLRGVHYSHRRQVIHRELKPSNVFFAQDGVAKIGDFGFAKSVIDPNQSSPGLKLGTPAYFSPEQSMGTELGPRSDLFAIGTVAYEMLTGKNPYQRDSIVDTAFAVTRAGAPEPATVVPTAHPLLSHVVRRLGAKDPADRYQSALEALEDLGPLSVLIQKRYPKVRQQFVHAPKDVARQLNSDEANLEVNRASKMMSWGESHRPRAALCFYRASRLDPSNADARAGLKELEENFGIAFRPPKKSREGALEKNLAKDPGNPVFLRELSERASSDGDIWGYVRYLRRLVVADPLDERAKNQLDSLAGVDVAAPFGKGKPERRKRISPKTGTIDREERTGVGLRVPLSNKNRLSQHIQER